MSSIKLIWQEIRIPALLLVLTLVGGATGYKLLYPEESWPRLIYFTAITLSTVGYGDTLGVEHSTVGTVYTIVLIFLGMGMVLYSASSITAFIIEGRLGELFKKQSIMRKVEAMEDHFIVCGVGETGLHVIKEISNSHKGLVIIDLSEERVHDLQTDFPKSAVLLGDATSDEVLLQANIKKAKSLIATLDSDKDNLFLTFTAKMLNPNLEIIAKATDLGMIQKIKNAGATYVVSPQFIGGMRIASQVLRPNVVSFLDKMLKGKDSRIRVNEFVIPKSSPLIGMTFKKAPIKEKTGVDVFAYGKSTNSDDVVYNPDPSITIEEGGVLLYISTPEQHEKMDMTFS